MAKDDQQEAYEKLLSAGLARAVDFLKFAETKNAALLTFSSAWILASVNLLATEKPLPSEFKIALSVVIFLFVISALIAIASLQPKLRLSDFVGTSARPRNLLYFGDVAKMEIGMFNERVRERYMPPANWSATDAYLEDLATQVAVVSQVADRKFRLFDWGARLAAIAVLMLLWPTSIMIWTWLRGVMG